MKKAVLASVAILFAMASFAQPRHHRRHVRHHRHHHTVVVVKHRP